MNIQFPKNNPNKNRKRGRNTERRVAKLMNAKRIGILGKEDCTNSLLSIEVKNRVRCTITKWVEQAKKNSPHDKIPIVRLHIHNKSYDSDLVIINIKDFEWLKGFYDKSESI